jgi:membrane protein
MIRRGEIRLWLAAAWKNRTNNDEHVARPAGGGGVVIERRVKRARRIYAVDVVYRALTDFSEQRGSVSAAAISYYAIFSLMPMLIFVAAIFGFVSRGTDLQTRVIGAILNQVPPSAGYRDDIQNVVSISAPQGGLLALFGFIGTIWTASNIFTVLRRALNQAFDIPNARPFITGRLVDMLSVLVVGLLVLMSIGATAALGILRAVSSDIFQGWLINSGWAVVFFLLPFVLSFGVFMMIYRVVPNRQIGRRDRTIGAILAALGFEFVKIGFTIYIANFGSYQQVYGAIGGIIAFLVFLNLESTIVIVSAEIAGELAKDRDLAETAARRPRQIWPVV